MKEIDQLDNERNDLLKKQNKINYDSRKWLDQSRSKHSNVSPSFPIKKSVLDKKKNADNDSETLDDQPKKRKRIRLDP
jgi:transcription termination factor Rho